VRQDELGGAAAPAGSDGADSLFARRPLAALSALAAIGAAACAFVTGENLPVGLLPQMSASLHVSLSSTGLLVTVLRRRRRARLSPADARYPARAEASRALGPARHLRSRHALAPRRPQLRVARGRESPDSALASRLLVCCHSHSGGDVRPQARGRVVAGVAAGSSAAIVFGVPAGTWLGQQAGWRVPFFVLSGVGLVCLGAVAFLLPSSKPSESHAAAATSPDVRRYRVLVATTMLAVGGFFTAFTYINPFLHRVSGLAEHDVAPVLVLSGLAGAIGIATAGALYDRRPRAATVIPVAAARGIAPGVCTRSPRLASSPSSSSSRSTASRSAGS